MTPKTWTAPNGVLLYVGQVLERTPENHIALAHLEQAMKEKEFLYWMTYQAIRFSFIPQFYKKEDWPVTITALPDAPEKPQPISFEEAANIVSRGFPVWFKALPGYSPVVLSRNGYQKANDYWEVWIANQEGRKFYAEKPEGGDSAALDALVDAVDALEGVKCE